MKGRKLCLLVINDDIDVPITVENIEVLELPGPSDPKKRLMTWEQHLWLWMHRKVPEFDLLLVDIIFEKDETSPKYFEQSQTSNPFGLLHALPLVGQVSRSNMPFVWDIHSSAKERVLQDPVAITCYGLLKAMEQPVTKNPSLELEFKNPRRSMKKYFQKQLASDESATRQPDQVAQELVGKYRAALLVSCQSYLSLDYENLDRLLALAERFAGGDEKAGDELGDSTLDLTSGLTTDSISVRSIFADQKNWTPVVAQKVLIPDLKKLHETRHFTDIWPDVSACMDLLKAKQNADDYEYSAAKAIEEIVPLSSDHNARRDRVAVGVILCTILNCRHGKNKYDPDSKLLVAELLAALNYKSNDYQWLNRHLKTDVLGEKNRLTPSKFLAYTESNTLSHAFLRQCGRQYWTKLTGKKDLDSMPICLQDPRSYDGR